MIYALLFMKKNEMAINLLRDKSSHQIVFHFEFIFFKFEIQNLNY
jgi:hypothetical protein